MIDALTDMMGSDGPFDSNSEVPATADLTLQQTSKNLDAFSRFVREGLWMKGDDVERIL